MSEEIKFKVGDEVIYHFADYHDEQQTFRKAEIIRISEFGDGDYFIEVLGRFGFYALCVYESELLTCDEAQQKLNEWLEKKEVV